MQEGSLDTRSHFGYSHDALGGVRLIIVPAQIHITQFLRATLILVKDVASKLQFRILGRYIIYADDDSCDLLKGLVPQGPRPGWKIDEEYGLASILGRLIPLGAIRNLLDFYGRMATQPAFAE